MIPRQILPTYSNYEVYRSKSKSKYLNIDLLIGFCLGGSAARPVF